MTTNTVSNSTAAAVDSRDQLIASFAKGEKTKDRWRIGTEHEKFRLFDERSSCAVL